MKRPAPDHDETRNPKRVKSDSKPQDDVNLQVKHRRCPRDLVTKNEQGQKMAGPRGHLRGEVYKWTAIAQGLTFVIQVPIESTKKNKTEMFAFEVVISGPGEDVLKALEVRDRDEMHLSLKGAALSPVAKHKPRAPTHRLIYRTGIHFRWKGQETNTFGSPVRAKVDSVVATATETSNQGPVDLSKKKQRQLLKEQKREVASKAPGSEFKPSNEAAPGPVIKPEPASPKLPLTQPAPPTAPEVPPAQPPGLVAVLQDVKANPPIPEAPNSDIALKLALARGFVSLEQMRTMGGYLDVVGVVFRSSEPRRSQGGTGDWFQELRLVDESTFSTDDLLSVKGLQVNVFGRQEQDLPRPKNGDIIFMQRVKTSNNHFPAVGYSNRYTWALYADEVDGGFHHHGNKHGPFFMPSADHIPIALALKEWWVKMSGLQEAELKKYQVADPGASIQCGRRREHRLIQDVHPGVFPDGYFNCTVEVLHGHMGGDGVFNLYVTDYTKRRDDKRHEATSWCPKGLIGCVLKIELWDDAAQMGPELQKGCFVKLDNVRMRLSNGGYYEGKMQEKEKKIRILDPKDTTDNPHFEALLERKAEYKAKNGEIENHVDDQVLSRPVMDQLFNCVAEVLHVETQHDESVAVYVTDYTKRDDLPPVKNDWAQGLDNMVVKVLLFDGQKRVSFKVGGYSKFNKLCLKPRGGVHGHLGGIQCLVQALNPQSEQLEALLNRKRDVRSNPPPIAPKRTRGVSLLTIKNYKGSFPQAFLVNAFVKMLPDKSLEQSLEQKCTRCGNVVPKEHVRCLACEDDGLMQSDSEETLVLACRIMMEICDQEGTGAYVNIPLESSLFHGIDTAQLLDHPTAQLNCDKRLKLLKDASVGHGDGKGARPLLMTVVAWKGDGGKLAFALDDCKLANGAPLDTLQKAP
ncbi:hypothetical protein BKA70DRAFT_1554421 [Coprinopsis sp. MPI-PUGE-AT-0042]|nr:hypothetical protein BKA70DRAFT_1554421 [Coprinopsis sp. MPI-PUGE-AT-0042]